ncbi:MAG: hypothetical protein D6784_11920 [Chloroflexi bacterium]|nr:MAG: hypothetical protein D6784_11920 [Chloroflexota bacterium]
MHVAENASQNPLSRRELEVLEMVATGASNQEIARQLVISVNTVKVHLRNIFEKLEVQSRTEATRRALQEGWITLDEPDTPTEPVSAGTNTFILPADTQTLNRRQAVYLLLALLVAAGYLVFTLLPFAAPQVRPDLPVIYGQPTPSAPKNGGSSDWKILTAMPTRRAGLAAAVLDGKVFAIGGIRANNQPTRLVEIFDPAANTWSEGAARPTAATDFQAAVVGKKIYTPGGCTSSGQALDTLEIYSPPADAWTTGASLPAPRCGYALAVYSDTLYLFGGWDGEQFTDTVFVYHPDQNRWDTLDTHLPRPKGYAGAAVLDNAIYVVGGYNGQEEFAETHRFLPGSGQWEERASLHEKRGGLGLVAAAGKLYAIGGGWSTPAQTVEKYDPAIDEWTSFDPPFSRHWRNMGLAVGEVQIFALGGWDETDQEFLDSVVSYRFLYQLFLPISTFK